jgi:antitoxin (DNA-binding transcriptional repressor) of toxin-antitoxin stability system
VRIAQFNDVDVLRAALEPGDVALVLTEPAMTNRVHLLAPDPGWHAALRELTRGFGTLLAVDETHTHVVGAGGATARYGLNPDVVTIGKAVAGGVPMGAYGVTAALGEELSADRRVATGGTLFGNPLSAAAAKAALTQVLVADAYQHTSALGARLADGIQAAITASGLPVATQPMVDLAGGQQRGDPDPQRFQHRRWQGSHETSRCGPSGSSVSITARTSPVPLRPTSPGPYHGEQQRHPATSPTLPPRSTGGARYIDQRRGQRTSAPAVPRISSTRQSVGRRQATPAVGVSLSRRSSRR